MEPFSLLWMGLCSTTLGNSLLFMKKKTNKQKYLKHFFEIWKQNISHYFEWVSAVICHPSVAMQVWSLCQWESNKGEHLQENKNILHHIYLGAFYVYIHVVFSWYLAVSVFSCLFNTYEKFSVRKEIFWVISRNEIGNVGHFFDWAFASLNDQEW